MPSGRQVEILASIAGRLKSISFRKRHAQIFVCDLEKGCTGFVGLNLAHHPVRAIEINPVIGVRIELVEDKLSALTGRDTRKLGSPMISCNVGYSSSDNRYRTYLFTDVTDMNAEVNRLVEDVQMIGMPTMRPICNINKAYSEITNLKTFQADKRRYYEPILIAMLDDRDAAVLSLNMHLESVSGQSGLAAQDYRRFSARFLESLDAI